MNLVDKIPFIHFKPIFYREDPIWNNFDQLNGFINLNFGAEYHDILGKPFLAGEKINWHTSKKGDFKPLDSLSLAGRQKSLVIYHLFLKEVTEKVKILRATSMPDNIIWADLLELILSPDNNVIYSNGTDIMLLWGFQFHNKDENEIDPSVLSSLLAARQADANMQETVTEDSATELVGNETAVYDNESSVIFPLNRKIIVRSNKTAAGAGLFLRYWWVWLLLALLIYLLYLQFYSDFFKANGNSHAGELVGIIPADPLKRPVIDTSRLIKGDSGTTRIVSDIFNIALKDKSKDFSEFAIKLKKAFPDSSYRIVFFDSSISRLQFQFPDSNRTDLKEKIRKEMEGYDLLIWDESVFINNKTFNDPVFKNPKESWHLTAIGAPAAWDLTSGSKDIVIAVIDDGFDVKNPDFSDKVIKPFNVKSRNGDISASSARLHGTHVAGLALGKADNNFGIAGIAPGCSFMPIQIMNDDNIFTSSDVIDGLLYAIRNGANVVNISLGKYFSDEVASLSVSQQQEFINNTGKDEEQFWEELFLYAEKENTTIVIATGNQHILAGLDPMQRSDKTIKVASINSKLQLSAFSNYGSEVTISAPGENVFSCIPGNKTSFMDGTSMAAPLVAGTIALMKSKNKNIRFNEIIDLIRNNSEPVRNNNGVGYFIKADRLLRAMR